MKVLHLGKYWAPARGGIESFVEALVHAQRCQGIDSRALVHGTPLKSDPAWLTRVPVDWTLAYAPMSSGYRKTLVQLLEVFSPEVVHIHLPSPVAAWLATIPKPAGVQWIVHWHSDVECVNSRLLKTAYALYAPFERRLLQRADKIIGTSSVYVESSPVLKGYLNKVRVIPLGLAELSSRPLPARRKAPRPLSLVYIGRLARYKGLDTLITAAGAHPRVTLTIAGGGEQAAELRAQAQQYSNIVFLGEVPESEKLRLLEQSDFLCLPSTDRTEAFGLSVVEALSLGVPCLVSDLEGSGLSWIAGVAQGPAPVKVSDVQDWSQRIANLPLPSNAQYQDWSRRGREAFEQHFTIEKCSTRISQLYLEVATQE